MRRLVLGAVTAYIDTPALRAVRADARHPGHGPELDWTGWVQRIERQVVPGRTRVLGEVFPGDAGVQHGQDALRRQAVIEPLAARRP
ncbi:hypothetical protein, partial [Streptosporangium sp. NPDC003464]